MGSNSSLASEPHAALRSSCWVTHSVDKQPATAN